MSHSRHGATPSTCRTPPWRRAHPPAARRTRMAGAFGLAGILLTASCSTSHSYAQLAKVGRSIPVPAGLTYVNEFDHVNRGDFGDNQNEVDINYSNPSMSCNQLMAAWLIALRKTYPNAQGAGSAGPTGVNLKVHGVGVTVDSGGAPGLSNCTHPRVAVGTGVS